MGDVGISSAIGAGVVFLKSVQQKDGSFESFSSVHARPFRPAMTYRTTFTPAIMLAALCHVAGTSAIRRPLAAWLRHQKSEQWSFNYWAAGAPERHTMPYPDDLDDTFCALTALYGHDAALVDGEALGHAVRLLVATESKVGGPYRTWLVPEAAAKPWRDVDLAVNANVAYFLQQVAEPLPALQRFMERAIVAQKLASPYYPSAYPLVYYLARAYLGPKKQLLVSYLLAKQKDGAWDNSPLHTALAVSSLLCLGYPAGELLAAGSFLVKHQAKNGSWAAEGFCLDPAREGKVYASGAPALTTALVVEALSRLEAGASGLPGAGESAVPEEYNRVVQDAHTFFNSLGGELGKQGTRALRTMQQTRSSQEIILLPYMIASSLKTPLSNKAGNALVQLGLANVYGWIAYTIYDDFLDDEGQPLQLPVANASLRASVRSFELALPKHTAFQSLVRQTFDVIDAANAWEVANCRWQVQKNRVEIGPLPKYGNLRKLAERSLGHALTPLGVLAAAGKGPDSPEAKHLLKALRHYLIARQLSDDMHDWERDTRAGHVSFVVKTIIEELAITPGTYALKALLPTMQKQFWHQSLGPLCELVKRHIAASRTALKRADVLAAHNGLEALLQQLEKAMEETTRQQTNAKGFLRAYQ